MYAISYFEKKRWIHLGVVLRDDAFAVYVNATMVNRITPDYPGINSVVRTTCYFGHPSAPLYAYLDDVMFFNKALSRSEMQTTMNYYESYTYPPQTTTTSSQNLIYNSLTHSWLFQSSLEDRIAGKPGVNAWHTNYIPDRFGHIDSAVIIDYGYIQLPGDVFVNGSFSMCLWIYVPSLGDFEAAIYRFYESGNWNGVFLYVDRNGAIISYMTTEMGTYGVYLVTSGAPVITNGMANWTHLCVTWNENVAQMSLYVNGLARADVTLQGFHVQSVTRAKALLGDSSATLFMDSLSIFNRALLSSEALMLHTSFSYAYEF